MRTSATAIKTFLNGCLYRYHRRYVKNDMPKSVFGKEGWLGNAIHSTMEDVLNLKLYGKKERILKSYNKHYKLESKKSNAEKLTEEQHIEYRKKGKKILAKLILMMKKKNLLRDPVMAEEWFNIPLGKEQGLSENGKHILIGKMDAVFKKKGGELLVVDYKTGSWVPNQKSVDEDIQLTIYAFVIKTIFNQDCELSLAFPQKKEWKFTRRTEKQIEQFFPTLAEMEKLDYIDDSEQLDLTPSRDACIFCELKDSCEEYKKFASKL